MIDVYLTDLHCLNRRNLLRTDDAVEAEAQYLTAIRDHFGDDDIVWLMTTANTVDIALGNYILSRDWSGPCRERGELRAAQIWGHPFPESPTVAQVRALPRAAGLTRGEIAARAGYSKEAWDKWSAPASNVKSRAMPWAAYFTAMVRAGLHPELQYAVRTFPTSDSHTD